MDKIEVKIPDKWVNLGLTQRLDWTTVKGWSIGKSCHNKTQALALKAITFISIG